MEYLERLGDGYIIYKGTPKEIAELYKELHKPTELKCTTHISDSKEEDIVGECRGCGSTGPFSVVNPIYNESDVEHYDMKCMHCGAILGGTFTVEHKTIRKVIQERLEEMRDSIDNVLDTL